MKKTVLLSGFLAISFIFFGCPQVTMLGQIDKETKLEEAVIKGLVRSVVYFQNNLYACDGNIYVKKADAVRGWSKAAAPSGHIVKLAADTDNIYALTRENNLYNLYTMTNGNSWNKVELTGDEKIITIFDTGSAFNADSDSGTNSTAYIEIKNGETVSYKQLNGSSTHTPSKTPKSSIVSGDYYAIKEGTKDKPQWVIKGAGDTTLTSGKGTIHSIALSSDKSTLYVATNAGVKSYSTTDGKDKSLPGPNAPSTVKSSYNYFSVFAYEDAIYAAPALEGNVGSGVNGLFGYYESRGNWNVE
ncbi:MAG: hypothetical protein PUI38_04435 [Candidatus Treponema excrementipullorum]|nr:hypothetical protein [Spirochaetia bacterium]MDD7012085.1 hypothetical protein [Candidatus Treponema excrementipullorum]MDY4708296.1 hypothetical protein [Candidatus Treponema excrementipullorum]